MTTAGLYDSPQQRQVPTDVFIGVLLAVPRPPTMAVPVQMIDVVELGVADAQRAMVAGEISARQLTQAYLDRIASIDRAGPTLNSVIELNPDALDDADRLDAERAARKSRGPLHGIPVLVKDNIDVVGMVNSAGSLALANNRPRRDAFLVTRLRDAGVRHPRQDQLERMGELPCEALDVRLEQPRRSDAQSVRTRPQSVRFERRHRASRSRRASQPSASAPRRTAASSVLPRSMVSSV